MSTGQDPEHLARIARVHKLAVETLGSVPEADSWLAQPLPILRGSKPITLLDSDLGTSEVERVLQSIKWGVYL